MASYREYVDLILALEESKIPLNERRSPADIFAETPLIIRPISPPGSSGTLVGPDDLVWTMPFGIDSD